MTHSNSCTEIQVPAHNDLTHTHLTQHRFSCACIPMMTTKPSEHEQYAKGSKGYIKPECCESHNMTELAAE